MDSDTLNKLASGALMGGVLVVVWLVSAGVWKLVRSPSEGARRFRLVSGGLLGLALAALMVTAMGPVGAIITALLVGAGVWVIKGFRK